MRPILLAILALALPALSLDAQQRMLEGTVVDTAGTPLAGQVVVLHTVTAAGGRPIAQDTTDGRGRFAVPVPGGLGAQEVAFAAVRVDGRLYIGPMLEGGAPPPAPYVVTAGGASPLDGMGPAAGAGARPAAPAGTGSPAGPALLVFLPLAALVGFFVFRGLSDPGAGRRRMLVELAEIEERFADALRPLDDATREELEARKAALRDRLERRPAAERGAAV